jgi:hypothetical protein
MDQQTGNGDGVPFRTSAARILLKIEAPAFLGALCCQLGNQGFTTNPSAEAALA